MTYHFSGGVEIEAVLPSGVSIQDVKSEFVRRGIKGWELKEDGSDGVDIEAASMPFADCSTAYNSISDACDAMVHMGCTVSTDCGLHIHIGNALLKSNVTPEQYTKTSIDLYERTGQLHTDHADPFDVIVVKDVAIRLTKSANLPNGCNAMLSKSRRDLNVGGNGGQHKDGYNKWARLTSIPALEAANTIEELKAASAMGRSNYSRKYSAVNFKAWDKGTVEFRQHQGTIEAHKIWNWFLFLTNLFKQTLDTRISTGTQTIVHDTPSRPPFRDGGRVIDQYNLMRVAGGCTTRDIMMITGCSEGSVRRASSLIRDRLETNGFPRSSVITHDQISNGHQYGDGTDLSGYEIAMEVTVQGTGPKLLPDNSIGNASIWAGVSDEQYAWWQARITELA